MYWPSQLLPKKLLKFLWRGTACYCNVCKSSTRSFAVRGHSYPIVAELNIQGAGKRWVDCRVCGSSDRDRLLWEYLEPKLLQHPQANIDVLHIAPEMSISQALRALPSVQYFAVDKRTPGYYYPRWVKHADIETEFSTRPTQFDFILCGHVLEHVHSDLLALQQLIQKLKPQGQLLLSVPIALGLAHTRELSEQQWLALSQEEKIQAVGQADHRRLYGCDYLERWQSASQTNPKQWRIYETTLDKENRKKQGLNPKERLILFSKG